MAVNPASWGVLGNPTKEQVDQYMNMQPGKFGKMVADLKRKHRGKTPIDHTVFVVKKKMDVTVGKAVVNAFKYDDAVSAVRKGEAEIHWDAEPFKQGHEETSYCNYDPKRYGV